MCHDTISCDICIEGKIKLSNGLCGCRSECLTCFGTEASNCLSCSDPNLLLENGNCVISCSNGFVEIEPF